MKIFKIPVKVLGKMMEVRIVAPDADCAKRLVKRQILLSVKLKGDPQEIKDATTEPVAL